MKALREIMRPISRETAIRTDTASLRTEAEPDPSASLPDDGGERAVVDQFAADALDAAGALERGAAHEHAAARRSHAPRGRVEQKKEKHERRDQRALGERLAVERRHVRDQIVAGCARAVSPARLPGGMRDVGVGEQQILRIEARRIANARCDGPQFPGPARRTRIPRR